jgi:NitT/TauT family transport system substrate-binding protein
MTVSNLTKRDLLKGIAAGAVGISAASSLGQPVWAQGARPLTKMTMALSIPVMDLASCYYSVAPKTLGYWAQEGLDIEVMTSGGSTQSLALLDSGQVQIVSVGLSTLLNAVSKTKKPVGTFVTAYGITQFIVTENSKVKTVNDLKGGVTLGARDLGSAVVQNANGILRSVGLVPDRDYRWVSVGTGGPSVEALRSGRIDAYYGVDTEFAQMQNFGLKVRDLPKVDFDHKVPNIGIFAFGRDTIETKPDLVAGYLRGVAKGLVFCSTNPQAATKMAYDAYPQIRPNLPGEQAISDGANVMGARLRNAFPPGGSPLGEYPVAAVEIQIASLKDLGVISAAPPPINDWYNMSFIKAANDFDRAAIVAQAKAYR